MCTLRAQKNKEEKIWRAISILMYIFIKLQRIQCTRNFHSSSNFSIDIICPMDGQRKHSGNYEVCKAKAFNIWAKSHESRLKIHSCARTRKVVTKWILFTTSTFIEEIELPKIIRMGRSESSKREVDFSFGSGYLLSSKKSVSKSVPWITRNSPTIHTRRVGNSMTSTPKMMHSTAKIGFETVIPTFFNPLST